MSVPLTVNGVTFQYPQQFDKNWGPTLTGWSTAVTNALAPLSGGFLTLPYPTNGVVFRNSTNTGNLPLTVNGSNQLTFNGVAIGTAAALTNGHIFVGNVSNQPTDVAMSGDITISNTGVTTLGALKVTDSQISATAGIALSKLAPTTAYYWYVANASGVLTPIGLSASKAVVTDANGLPSAATVTSTELSYVSGVTSAIQTQINAISPFSVPSGAMMDFGGTSAPSGWLLCNGGSYPTSTYPALFAAIGYTWGGSGGSFNVPNMNRRVGVGSGGSGTGVLGNTVGSTGGEEAHTLSQAELPTAIGTASSSVTDPGHSHVEWGNSQSGAGKSAATYSFNNVPEIATVTSTGTSVTGISVSTSITNSGGGSAHNNIQPSAVVLKIIKY